VKTQRKASQLAATQPRLADAIPRQPDTDAVWQTFEASLANVLLLLEEDEYLIVSSKRHHHYVQFAGEGHHGMRIEAVSNGFIDDPADLSRGTSSWTWPRPCRPRRSPSWRAPRSATCTASPTPANWSTPPSTARETISASPRCGCAGASPRRAPVRPSGRASGP